LPPLCERIQDIGLFITAFIDEFNRTVGKSIVGVSSEALQLMMGYRWPGNIRELRNVIERAMVLCDGQEIQPGHLPAELSDNIVPLGGLGPSRLRMALPPKGVNLRNLVSQLEEQLIKEALAKTGGNQTRAATLLSISRDELRYRLQKYGLC